MQAPALHQDQVCGPCIGATRTSNTTGTTHSTPAPESKTYSITSMAEPIPFSGDSNRLRSSQ
jgi:hypothetical protein